MSRERLYRDDPERTEPIRDFWNVFRRSAPWWWNPLGAAPEEGGGESGGGAAAGSAEDDETWLGGIRAGYRVLDDQLQRGRRLADEQAARLRDAGPEDLREMTEQMMRSYSDAVIDMSMQWYDFVARFYRLEDWQEWGRRFGFPGEGPRTEDDEDAGEGPLDDAGPPTPPGASRGAATSGMEAAGPTLSIPVEVTSTRPTRVKLDVHGTSEALEVQSLRARQAEKPPLMDLGFTTAEDGPVLEIRVGEAQPEGHYHGVVLDRDSGELRGTLSVEIRGV